MLVLDASAALPVSAAEAGFAAIFGAEELVAPPHLWAEVRSSLHEALWRGEIDRALALGTLDRFEAAPIRPRAPRGLGREAWTVAEELGWAKTYDAEYVALARLLSCRLVTQDRRLHRRTKHLGYVISLSDL
jgi:predicted nucleic acid-binding protein